MEHRKGGKQDLSPPWAMINVLTIAPNWIKHTRLDCEDTGSFSTPRATLTSNWSVFDPKT